MSDLKVDPPSFKNACDYHLEVPTSLSTSQHAAAAKRSASCRACSIECSLQRFGKADRAECLRSCDPSPVAAGEGTTVGAQYPDPLSDAKFNEIRDTYLPAVTALECPSSSCSDGTSETKEACDAAGAEWTAVNSNGGKFAGSIQCRPFTDAHKKEVLAAATASATDGCGAMQGRGFRCDLDCTKITDVDKCIGEHSNFCKWTGKGSCGIHAKVHFCSAKPDDLDTKNKCEADGPEWRHRFITNETDCTAAGHTWTTLSEPTKVCLQKSCTSGLDMHDTKDACEADGFSWIPLRGAITNETECTSNGHEWKQLSASFCMEREDTDMTENQCIVGTLDHPEGDVWMATGGDCSTRNMMAAAAINMCSNTDRACKDDSAMILNVEGESCKILGASAKDDKDGAYGFDDKGIFQCVDAPTQLNSVCPNNAPFC